MTDSGAASGTGLNTPDPADGLEEADRLMREDGPVAAVVSSERM